MIWLIENGYEIIKFDDFTKTYDLKKYFQNLIK
jgi:hypothetical protein